MLDCLRLQFILIKDNSGFLLKTPDFILGCGFIENTRVFLKTLLLGLNPKFRNTPSGIITTQGSW